MASKRFLEDEELDYPQHKRPKLTEDLTTSHDLTLTAPNGSLEVHSASDDPSESLNGNALSSLSTSDGEIDYKFLDWLNGPESQTTLAEFFDQRGLDATPFQTPYPESTDLDALLENQAEKLAVNPRDSFAPTNGTMSQDSLQETNSAEHEGFLHGFHYLEGPQLDPSSTEGEMSNYALEGCDFGNAQIAAGELMVAAAPATDTCPLSLSDSDFEAISAFTFDSDIVEGQIPSVYHALNDPFHCVGVSTVTEEDHFSMAPQNIPRHIHPASEAFAASEFDLQLGNEQTQPFGMAFDGSPLPSLNTPALQAYDGRDMTPPIWKWRNQTPTTVENPAGPLYMPEPEDPNMDNVEDETPYRCDTCDKRFKLKRSLQRHAKVEHTDRMWSCPYCDKTYKRNDALIVHGRKQHGVELPHMPNHRAQGSASATPSTPNEP